MEKAYIQADQLLLQTTWKKQSIRRKCPITPIRNAANKKWLHQLNGVTTFFMQDIFIMVSGTTKRQSSTPYGHFCFVLDLSRKRALGF